MIHGWQVLPVAPDTAAVPADLGDMWSTATSVDAPGTVAQMLPGADDIDASDWWLRTTVTVENASLLRFGGLTAPARVFVDDSHVATCASMFLPVTVALTPGSHQISVVFASLDRLLRTRRPRGRWRTSLVAAQGMRWVRTTLIGRAPVYGGLPAPVGVWRPVELLDGDHDHACVVRVDADSGEVEVSGAADPRSRGPIVVEVDGPGGDPAADRAVATVVDGRFCVRVPVPGAQRWWPRGYGGQPLYPVRVLDSGRLIHSSHIGFRTVTMEPDSGVVAVNGVPIFCRGVTWSPPDPVALHVGSVEMEQCLTAVAQSGATMIRVVGGLVTEQPEFYRLCAELGVLVWQDAMVATTDPPDEVADLVCREMVELLRSVGGNPAMAVVSGGSETVQQPEMLGLSADAITLPLLTERLPAVVAEHGDVAYVPASPSTAGPGLAIRPDLGVSHWFGVGGYLCPIRDVREAGVRFAAETLAFSIPPTPEAVERHFGSAASAGHHPRWKAAVPRDRGASWDFEDVRDHYVREVFGVDPLQVRRTDPERYLQLGRAAVTAAMTECYSYWRRGDSGCAGALVLAGRDLVPGAGWGLFDAEGAAKAPVAALARLWSPTTVTVSDAGLSGVRCDVHHDGPHAVSGELALTAVGPTGNIVAEVVTTVEIDAHSSTTFFDSDLIGAFRDLSHAYRFGPASADGVQASLRIAGAERARDVLVVVARPDQVHTGLSAVVSFDAAVGWTLVVRAEVTLRYVEIVAPGWVPGDNWFHLLPGLPHRVPLAGVGTPTGRVTSVDAVASARIEVDTP